MFKWKVGCHNIVKFLKNALLISVTLPIEVKKYLKLNWYLSDLLVRSIMVMKSSSMIP